MLNKVALVLAWISALSGIAHAYGESGWRTEYTIIVVVVIVLKFIIIGLICARRAQRRTILIVRNRPAAAAPPASTNPNHVGYDQPRPI